MIIYKPLDAHQVEADMAPNFTFMLKNASNGFIFYCRSKFFILRGIRKQISGHYFVFSHSLIAMVHAGTVKKKAPLSIIHDFSKGLDTNVDEVRKALSHKRDRFSCTPLPAIDPLKILLLFKRMPDEVAPYL